MKRQFTQGLDPDPTVRQLVQRVHAVMKRVPAPACLMYREAAHAETVNRLVTPSILYEPGPVREWVLGLARELLKETL